MLFFVFWKRNVLISEGRAVQIQINGLRKSGNINGVSDWIKDFSRKIMSGCKNFSSDRNEMAVIMKWS